MATTKTRDLAIHGGTPVRGKDSPLPQRLPQEVNPKAKEYFSQLVDSGLQENFLGRFEKEFGKLLGVKHVVGIANCTAACHTALAAAGVGPGDEVVAAPVTDYGTIYGIIAQRAIPVFADVNPLNGNVTGESVEKVTTKKTRAIIIVHMAGIPCDMDPILDVAKQHGLPVIEDCCQAHLATYKGRITGTIGDIGCFSFDTGKLLSVLTGGAAVTNDAEYAARLMNFAGSRGSYGEGSDYGRRHKVLGMNYRFDSVRAALALAELEVLPQQIARRKAVTKRLTELLSRIDGIIPCPVPENSEAVYWIYPFIVEIEKFAAGLHEFADAIGAEGLNPKAVKGCYRSPAPWPFYAVCDSFDFLNDLRFTYTAGAQPGGPSDTYLSREYSVAMTPNAKWYVDHMLSWLFTHKYSDRDIADIAEMIRKAADAYRR